MALDFRSAADLFMGSEEELARALRLERSALAQHRRNPRGVPDAVLRDLADVLAERGRAMVRVAEMLRDDDAGDAIGADGNGTGA